MKPVRVEVNDLMQRGYVYLRTKPAGRDFRADFKPELTPKQMLELGVFGGKVHDGLHGGVPDQLVCESEALPGAGMIPR